MAARQKNLLQEFQPEERREESLAALYHEASKFTQERKIEVGQRIAHVQNRPDLVRRMAASYKTYPYLPQVPLPKANFPPQPHFQETLVQRRSARKFDPTLRMTLLELANLLQLSYGITGSYQSGPGITQYLRVTPSAGAIYPLELYVLVQRVEGLEPGLYHYRVAHHALEQLEAGDQTERLKVTDTSWGMWPSAAVDVFITGVFDRMAFKYRGRGYRFVLMEAGMLSEQMTLLAECQGVRSCIMGGFVDDEVNDMLGVDGVTEAILVALCLGK